MTDNPNITNLPSDPDLIVQLQDRILDLSLPLSRLSSLIERAASLARDLRSQSTAADAILAQLFRVVADMHPDGDVFDDGGDQ